MIVRHRRQSRPIPLLAALLLAAVAVLVPLQPAAAHDTLLGSDPAAGSVLESLPAQVRLDFSAALLSDGGSTVVEVTDAAGASLTDGDPVVEQNTVTQALEGDAAGAVTVRWRVVSSDGHPISDEFTFSVDAPVEPAPTPEATAQAPEPTDAVTAAPSETPLVTTTAGDDAASPLPWLIGGGIAVVVIAVVVGLLAARARQSRDVTGGPGAGRAGSGGR
ncbi:copper resistance CopC family protein [Microbacterium sp. GXF7504]